MHPFWEDPQIDTGIIWIEPQKVGYITLSRWRPVSRERYNHDVAWAFLSGVFFMDLWVIGVVLMKNWFRRRERSDRRSSRYE